MDKRYLNGRLVGSQLGLQPLVLLPQVLNSRQVPSVVLGTHQQLLLSVDGEKQEGKSSKQPRESVAKGVRRLL